MTQRSPPPPPLLNASPLHLPSVVVCPDCDGSAVRQGCHQSCSLRNHSEEKGGRHTGARLGRILVPYSDQHFPRACRRCVCWVSECFVSVPDHSHHSAVVPGDEVNSRVDGPGRASPSCSLRLFCGPCPEVECKEGFVHYPAITSRKFDHTTAILVLRLLSKGRHWVLVVCSHPSRQL